MATLDFLTFAQARRAALLAQIDDCTAEVTAYDAAIAELTAGEPVPDPQPDPAPEPDPLPEPEPDPAPVPSPTPTPPIIGTTVAADAADLMNKVAALKGKSGDQTIGVKDGHHAPLTVSGLDLAGGKLTIVAENRRQAMFERVTLSAISDVRMLGLGSCPAGDATPQGPGTKLYGITAMPNTARIEVIDAFCQGHIQSADHANWTLADWRARAMGGVFLQGPDSLIDGCYAEGVRFGFNLTGKGSRMRNLHVSGGSGDFFRISADDVMIENVLGTDAVYMNDGNHPDGLQAFGPVVNRKPTPLRRLSLRNIALIEWTKRHDNPLRWNANLGRWGIMQGIGLHQTLFEDLVADDIFVKTNVANGIHIGGVKNINAARWRVISGDHGLASFDKRFPKIDIHASGSVSINDVEGQAMTAVSQGLVQNARPADYLTPPPAWVAPLLALAS